MARRLISKKKYYCGVADIWVVGSYLRFRFLQQNHVRLRFQTQDAQTLSIRRPVEFFNLLRMKLSNLVAGRAIERLEPNVIRPVLADDIGHGLPIGSELRRPPKMRIHTMQPRRSQ